MTRTSCAPTKSCCGRFYYNRGYADFRVISSFAELDETSNEYVVTITVEEGERYVFGDVSIESTVPGIDSDSLKGPDRNPQRFGLQRRGCRGHDPGDFRPCRDPGLSLRHHHPAR